MLYHIKTLEKSASNFRPLNEHIFKPNEVKFILNEPLHKTLLPSNVQQKFNSVVMPQKFEKFIEEIHNMKVYEDDTWVISFPRCGSNWTQEAVWQICNGLDFDDKGKISLEDRFPVVEQSSLMEQSITKKTKLDCIEEMSRPRFIKSHLPIAFLPKELWEMKPKIVYVERNVKDAAVSWYHFNRDAYLYQGTLDEFLDLYLKGHVELGDYWDHYEQYHLLAKYCSHFKMIKYEEMKKDLRTILVDLCKFLNKPMGDEQIQLLCHRLSFENMKTNPANNYEDKQKVVQHFLPGFGFQMIRKGQVGSFKEEMSEELIKRFDARTEEVMKRLKD